MMVRDFAKKLLRRITSIREHWFARHQNIPNQRIDAGENVSVDRARPGRPSSTGAAIAQFFLSAREANKKSRFLTDLPPEIRRSIYGYVVGGQLLHLDNERNRTVVRRCRSPEECVADGYSRDARNYFRYTGGGKCSQTLGIVALPLLLSCSQIYVEAIEILYKSNVFDFDDLDALIYFANCTIPLSRLQQIRHLSFRLNRSRHSDLWNKGELIQSENFKWRHFWRLIATGMRLSTLKVRIMLPEHFPDAEVDADWVKPMLTVRGIRKPDIKITILTPGWDGKPQDQLNRIISDTMRLES